MIRNNFILRFFACFFLLNTLWSVLLPTLSWALTAGPTAPEASSFEPVDTTDMVNHITGDFTYGMPLMEVPGPYGGYPLALSYHAGIQPGLEASWVGLGWTLNPGAVTRLVNGFPDDYQDAPEGHRFFWEGGVRKSYNIGVSVGLGEAASASAGLVFASDTYQGFGLGASIGGGFGVLGGGDEAGLGVGGSVGISPFGWKIYWLPTAT